MGITAATVSSANTPEELSLPSAPRDPRVERTLALMAVLVGVAVVGALTHLGSVVIGSGLVIAVLAVSLAFGPMGESVNYRESEV